MRFVLFFDNSPVAGRAMGIFVLTLGDGERIVARQGEGLLIPAGTRMKISWPGPCQWFVCTICHREEDGSAQIIKTFTFLPVLVFLWQYFFLLPSSPSYFTEPSSRLIFVSAKLKPLLLPVLVFLWQ